MSIINFRTGENLKNKFNQNNDLILDSYHQLISGTGKGNDFLGWRDLPISISEDKINSIDKAGLFFRSNFEVVVIVGIGGSYLGARAVIDALQSPFVNYDYKPSNPIILFAGNQLSEDYLAELVGFLDNKSYGIVVVSKSGTTTEPAIAFRILKKHCEDKFGKKESSNRIIAITDEHRGALLTIAKENNYQTFSIPDDVGGRYSVLTPVGLLPIAIAGFDINLLIDGAKSMRKILYENNRFETNIAMQYAFSRFILYQENKLIEMMVSYQPQLFYFIEWYKQLFGESEGKANKGIFPSGAVFSTDLHSLGQYIQEGSKILFETVLTVKKAKKHIFIPFDDSNLDQLNYLQQRSIQEINLIAEEGTRQAHLTGGVPNLTIEIDEINEYTLGALIYFFEFSCALGGYLLDINPFDQPGVEAYKKNMFRLLGKV